MEVCCLKCWTLFKKLVALIEISACKSYLIRETERMCVCDAAEFFL
jgi:hypothetical protein